MSRALILVTGATGTVGSEVVKQLAATGQRVRALVRDPKKAERFPKAVVVVHGDLEKPETLAPAFAGVDKAFVLSAGPMLPAMEGNAFAAAKKGGVGHIVKLSARHVGADFMAPTPLAQWHRNSEQRLCSLGIPWTILRPGTFASNVLSWLDRKNNAILLPVGDGRDSLVDPRDIAAVAVELLTLPGQAGRIYEISGSEWLSFAQVAQRISELTGKQASYHNIPEET
ncbi:MAG TPA: SDR family oxidoreductase, partial [Gemmataceae bacterium]|nr:SDR family oxidoreductase [Gemmataceae bacterium]